MSESTSSPHHPENGRRTFLRSALTGAATLASAPWLGAASTPEVAQPKVGVFAEPAQDLPLGEDVDVIVCGAGPAGIAAALAAARAGAKTRLIEIHGCLGGVWTAGLLTYIFDFNKPGIAKEIIRRLDERDARRSKLPDQFVYEPEEMKVLLEEMCVEAGVKIHLHTRLAAAYRDGRKLTTVITESKSGRQAWRAPVFIDATGDGDLGAMARCGWDIGQGGAECPCQPMTLNTLAVVKDAEALKNYISFYQVTPENRKGMWDWHHQATEGFKNEIIRAGFKPSYGMPTLFQVRDNLVMVMINHEYGIKAFDAPAITEATIRARAEVFNVVRGLRKLGGPWEGMQIVATPEQIGVRDGRRIHGRYTVNRDDLATGVRHEDAVTRATFGVDIHAHDKEANDKKAIIHADFKFHPYDIPLRALIAKDVDGLLMAGRCISGDFTAHASYRVHGELGGHGRSRRCHGGSGGQNQASSARGGLERSQGGAGGVAEGGVVQSCCDIARLEDCGL
ncbi:FAD-dependent oxidoreductase [Verrucomicrobium sp. BvORR106]|uniref:FAD-dependent oxidoreductase n=1 Tax=Verrucomicrobium sp. BvORR106 TaxID=1403819 RepID=UPI002240FE2F|nr:FAD-dependent oxidoreductase [Verrucomicrobium sp. BvORR106]